MIHVVKPKEAKHRNSFGVAFDLLAIGPQSMVTKMHYRKDNVIPFHSHPNEQTGYILSGRICVLTRDSRHELGPDDTYAIPANIEHSIEIIEDAEEVQKFDGLRRLRIKNGLRRRRALDNLAPLAGPYCRSWPEDRQPPPR